MTAKKISLAEISTHIAGRLEGSPEIRITGLAELHLAQQGDLSFLISDADLSAAEQTKASAVLLPASLPPVSLPMIRVKDVSEAINTALELFAQPRQDPVGIHPQALVASDAVLAHDVSVGPYSVVESGSSIGAGSILQARCSVGRGCVIGEHCHLRQGVVVADGCRIGCGVMLGENVVIGSEGFGYRTRDGCHRQVPHLGAVRIGDDVEIGAGSCVARAKFGFTVIGDDTKIDSLVYIAHNVRVGEHCLIAAQAGIAGSARLGQRVVFGGQVGVRDHVAVGDGVTAGARTAIHHDVPAGSIVLGVPALERRQALREQAALRRLPELVSKVKKLQQRLDELESAADHS
ncbi:MAG: UDP-3-O-(3-hydroxymyristoyl)glucosamine N-acyltransferase [Actinobacteria bacterium]|nr:UDP-3-O-(3-hydroxymyristoyl)glucosamine N-acyltransferase [Actinomycetota bacterium]